MPKDNQTSQPPPTIITLTLPTPEGGGIAPERATATLLIQRGELAHMRHFEHPGMTQADDFSAMISTLKHVHTIIQTLNETIPHASDIHNWQGRCAYHLLIAAQVLTTSASVLLKEGDTAYFHEKLTRGITHITDAFEEGLHHGKNQAWFQLRKMNCLVNEE